FHPEVDRNVLEAGLVDDADELRSGGIDPQSLLDGADQYSDDARGRTDRLVDRFVQTFVRS
ncbi:MAG: glutamine amidotransferase, partial [Actinomycetes bacterium]